MAIALTPFKAFLNFLPLQSLLLNLLSTTELDSIIPFDLTSELASSLVLPNTRPPTSLLYSPTQAGPTDAQKDILKRIFDALMSRGADPGRTEPQLDMTLLHYYEFELVGAFLTGSAQPDS